MVRGSTDLWRSAPLIVAGVAALLAVATYVAERSVDRRETERRRATGEPRRTGTADRPSFCAVDSVARAVERSQPGQCPARSWPWPFCDASATTFSWIECGTSA